MTLKQRLEEVSRAIPGVLLKLAPADCRAVLALLAAAKGAEHRMTEDGYEPHHHDGKSLVNLRTAIAAFEEANR